MRAEHTAYPNSTIQNKLSFFRQTSYMVLGSWRPHAVLEPLGRIRIRRIGITYLHVFFWGRLCRYVNAVLGSDAESPLHSIRAVSHANAEQKRSCKDQPSSEQYRAASTDNLCGSSEREEAPE